MHLRHFDRPDLTSETAILRSALTSRVTASVIDLSENAILTKTLLASVGLSACLPAFDEWMTEFGISTSLRATHCPTMLEFTYRLSLKIYHSLGFELIRCFRGVESRTIERSRVGFEV